jgi:hypothetical protein
VRDLHHAPGFPLQSFGLVRRRPQDDLWICRLRALPTIAYTTDHDETDPTVYCKRVSDFTGTARAGYWFYKAFQWIEQHPF